MDHPELLRAGGLAPGEVIADRFEIERLAGEGGMATVYRARDRQTGDIVAVKQLHPDGGENAERLLREARVMARLAHPAIVRYVDHGTTAAGNLYLAMEWLEGEDLAQRIARTPLSVEDTLVLARRTADALALAHDQGLVHRDLKPSNLFLPGGRVEEAKLLDFGIVRMSKATIVATATGSILGTPAYMAPEQARGEAEVDGRADLFSLGCVLAECLTGRQVFSGEHALAVLARILLEEAPPVRDTRPDVPPALDALIGRLLAKDREERPAGAAAVREALDNLDLEAGPTAAAAAPFAAGITSIEQKVLAVVLVAASPATRRELPQTYHLAAGRHGGRLERLADGSVLVVLSGSAAATDLVQEAARCALALRDLAPGVPIALATGRGALTTQLPVGEVIDRAVSMLRGGRSEDAGPRLDAMSAGLIDNRFTVQGDDRGMVLAGEQEIEDDVRILLGKRTTCVGREREMGNLIGLWDECVGEPRASAVIVTAGPGIGKSRLRSELVQRARETQPDLEVWIARGDPISAGAPFSMIGQMIRRAAHAAEAEAGALQRKKLGARLERHLRVDLGRVAEFLAELIGAPVPPEESSVGLQAARQDARVMGDQMLRAFEEFMEAEVGAGPRLLVFENLQWGDAPSLRFVDAALRRLRERPLFVTGFGRPEIDDLFPKLWAERDAQAIRLGELTARAATKLVREVLGAEVPDATVERVVAQAGGNAFYLEELIRAVAEGLTDLPGTVVAMAQARLDQLEPEARRVLRAGSVFGDAFWRAGVEALLGGQPQAALLDGLLEVGIQREIIVPVAESRFPGERQFRFRQALVREAAHASLTDEDLTLAHRLAGEWLEAAGEHEAVVLAEHFDRGGAPERAVPWYIGAANQALQGSDLVAVLARTQRGSACGAQGESLARLRIMEAQAHMWRGEHEDERACAMEAASLLPPGTPEWCTAIAIAMQSASSLGNQESLRAIAATLEAVATASSPPAPALLGAAARGVQALLRLGCVPEADRLLDWLDREGDATPPISDNRLYILMARSARALLREDLSAFLHMREEAAALCQPLGYDRAACTIRENIGYGYLQFGMFAEAEAALREARASAQRLGLRTTEMVATNNLGLALAWNGQVEEGQRLEEEALVQANRTGNVRIIGGVRIYLARILLLAGDLARAEAEADTAIEVLANAPPLRALALGVLAQVRLAAGRPAEALEASAAAIRLLDELGALEEGEVLVRVTHARALEATGDGGTAFKVLALALARMQAYAEKITEPEFQARFLHAVPENAEARALARAWSRGPGDS